MVGPDEMRYSLTEGDLQEVLRSVTGRRLDWKYDPVAECRPVADAYERAIKDVKDEVRDRLRKYLDTRCLLSIERLQKDLEAAVLSARRQRAYICCAEDAPKQERVDPSMTRVRREKVQDGCKAMQEAMAS